MRSETSLLLLAWAVWWVVVAALAGGVWARGDSVSLERFSLWTNVLFAWPAVRAATLGAWNEASVFTVTLVVSTLHHGCVRQSAVRAALAAETYVALAVGVLLTGSGALIAAAARWRPLTRPRLECLALSASMAGGALLVGSTYLVSLTPDQLDGCALFVGTDRAAYEAVMVPALVGVWSTVDFVTAFSALIVVVVYLMQVPGRLELAVFWLFAVLVLVGTLYSRAGLSTLTALYLVVGVAALVAVGARCVACCGYAREAERRRLVERYDAIDAVVAAVVGVGAILLFVTYNTARSHGWWHVAASVALYFGIEAVYRRYSFGAVPAGPRHPRDRNV